MGIHLRRASGADLPAILEADERDFGSRHSERAERPSCSAGAGSSSRSTTIPRRRRRGHETVVDGLAKAPEAMTPILDGDDIGKILVRLVEPAPTAYTPARRCAALPATVGRTELPMAR